jgi:hypothetical protein
VTQPIERDSLYRRRRFPRDVIETCVRWYLTYRLSYRDLSPPQLAQPDPRSFHLRNGQALRICETGSDRLRKRLSGPG